MTKIIVRELIFDEYNLEHIRKHNVTAEEIGQVGQNFVYHRKSYSGRYIVVGRVGHRILTIIVRRLASGKYYPVTARDADKKERRVLYEKEK